MSVTIRYLGDDAVERIEVDAARLAGAILDGLSIHRPLLEEADLQGISLRDARVYGGFFALSDLSGADLTGGHFRNSMFDGAILRGASMQDADFTGASFVGARLDGVSFASTRLLGADFTGAVLADADLSGATDLESARFDRAVSSPDTIWPEGFDVQGRGVIVAGRASRANRAVEN